MSADTGLVWPFAEVAVDAALGRSPAAFSGRPARDATYHYGIPPELVDRIVPGKTVWVPFGRKRLQGIVVALHAQSPVERTRDISAVVEAMPTLPADGIALARWLNAHYLAPFYECLKLLLPPGGSAVYERRFARSDSPIHTDDLRDLSKQAQRVLGLLQGEKELGEPELEAAGIKRPDRALKPLLEAGLVEARTRLRPARVRIKRQKVAELVDPSLTEQALDEALRSLKPNRRADAIAFLRRPEIILPSVEDLREASSCSPAELRDLQSRELITLDPGGQRVEAGIERSAMETILAGPLAQSPARARLLRFVAQQDGSIDRDAALESSAADGKALDALVSKGWLRLSNLPSSVLLHPSGGRAREAEHELRRATALAEALDFLVAAGGRARAADVTRETRASSRSLRDLASAGLITISDEQVWRDPLAGKTEVAEARPELTDDQARAWEGLRPRLGQGNWTAGQPQVSHPTMPEVCLVHGVTGSGKTELYLRAIEHVLFQGRQAIVLVPEIALTPQTVRRFSSRFPGRVGVWHSELSEGERLDTWHRARQGLLEVIVGSRSAIFAPLTRLGLIVVDESHADAYKQARTPRYHARDVALRRAALEGAVVLLGSATPSVESYHAAEAGRYTLLELPRRVVGRLPAQNAHDTPETRPGREVADRSPATPASAAGQSAGLPVLADMGELPPVEIVDMRAELKEGNTSMFSRELDRALHETLAQAGQAILFLNRRGSATFVLCRDCGYVSACPRCEAPLTWHGHGRALICHQCNHHQAPPMMCPECGSPRIRYFGAGTQKVEEAAQAAFPEARILRWDADTTGRKGAHEAILAQFIGGRADILVGTQMVAKGLDLPRVTLVGVISADTGLHFPDFRSSERSFQLLSQVAGRAGRSALGGRVILQTYAPDNPAIVSAAAHDYAGFYQREMAFRASSGYPPFGRLIRLIYLADRDRSAAKAAREMAETLNARIQKLGLADTRLIGPSPAFFRMMRGKARWHIIIRSPNPHALLEDWVPGAGWRVDVDPVDLL